MLVLTRRVNESVLIGKDIKVTVLAVKGDSGAARVKLGFAAPDDVAINREELKTPYQPRKLET